MSRRLLDTDIVGHAVRGDRPDITRRLAALAPRDVVISAVTEGELVYGLVRRGHPALLTRNVRAFLVRVDVLPSDQAVAGVYGALRRACEAEGLSLAPLDMMIAAHAAAIDATLVTRDKAFAALPAPCGVETWGETGT